MDKEKNGEFSLKALLEGSLDKNKVICIYCFLENFGSQIPLAGQAHSCCRELSSPSPMTDHGEQFATKTPGQLYVQQAFDGDS